ncbi:MAG: hypothetical protein M3Z24_02550, partial [Chloroflexota bacterium]|nr:hypothetical protein [Chloroflexota bacterium]
MDGSTVRNFLVHKHMTRNDSVPDFIVHGQEQLYLTSTPVYFTSAQQLLHRHRLRQISRLIHITSSLNCCMISEQLQR